MIKISGLNELTKQLKEAQTAIASIDGQIGLVTFLDDDPSSIEMAIQEVENMVDSKLSKYKNNPLVAPIILNMKKHYREGIIQRAAESRLKKQAQE